MPAYPEIRPDNTAANRTRATRPPWRWSDHGGGSTFQSYYERITGACQGTTEQILEWAAVKWGFERDLFKAQAVQESWWRQATQGDNHSGATNYGDPAYPDGFQSFGLLQVKRSVWPGSWPMSQQSSAYGVDYAAAVMRAHYDGALWLGDATRGSVRNSVAAWFCGCGWDGQSSYTNTVFRYLSERRWTWEGF